VIPVHLVTGFLGAGKTSFLNRLLGDPALGDTLVVVNEFGEAALDHRLYERLDGEIALLSSGCLCCALRGDFVEGLQRLLSRRDAGELSFRRIVVETSGLADPGPILHALFADATLAARLRLANVTTLVDAVNGLDTLDRHGEARRQVALADRLALSKTDLAPPRGCASGSRALRLWRRFLRRGRSTPPPSLPRSRARRPATRPARPMGRPRRMSSGRPRRSRPRPSSDSSRYCANSRALRVKGLVATADDPSRPWLVQGAQHAFAPPLRLSAWPQGARETSLVVIGEGVSGPAQRLWDALTGVVAPDAPDWEAMADNPLAPGSARGLLG
jgi:G3E family GTPase